MGVVLEVRRYYDSYGYPNTTIECYEHLNGEKVSHYSGNYNVALSDRDIDSIHEDFKTQFSNNIRLFIHNHIDNQDILGNMCDILGIGDPFLPNKKLPKFKF